MSTPKRSSALPNVPTTTELGYKNSDTVIVHLHWGTELQKCPNEAQRAQPQYDATEPENRSVARANRCHTVWSPELGFATVFGFDADIDAVAEFGEGTFPDGFEFDFAHDRIMLDTKTPVGADQGGGFGPTEFSDGSMTTTPTGYPEEMHGHGKTISPAENNAAKM